ncbi:uncharacterized protein LOC101102694 isoform X15 [Ovis aries]|uniref:uncharacterized protein LOC101102694 isoform X15 n=1 Tax=Ovis aries TaxID=9940 RepID=UPI00295281D7|nr:uncharacterized protein LOC101102694 isoform X15 [Ovis aries]
MSREGAALCSAPSGRGLREARSAVLTLLDPETGGNGVRGPRWRRRRLFWFLRGAVDGLRRVPSNRQRGRLLAGPWVPAHRRRRLGPGTCRSAPVALPLAGGASGADWRLPGALRARPVTGRPQNCSGVATCFLGLEVCPSLLLFSQTLVSVLGVLVDSGPAGSLAPHGGRGFDGLCGGPPGPGREPLPASAPGGPHCARCLGARQVRVLSPQTREQEDRAVEALPEPHGAVGGEVELLLPVVTGRPEHLHEQVALLGHARAGGPHGVPGQHILLLPAAGLVLRVVHAAAPSPRVQPQQGRVYRGCQDHRDPGGQRQGLPAPGPQQP